MIIFGTQGITYTSDRGRFHCPQCGGDMDYTKKRVRRFFTLYFIPLIPLDKVGEYVECSHCRGTFRDDVLSYDPDASAQQMHAAYQDVMLRVMVHMMLADGEVDAEEIKVIREVYGKLSDQPIDDAEIQARIEASRRDAGEFQADLAAMGALLNESGKEMVIRAACLVAAADGVFQEEEKQFLGTVADAIQMSPAHFRGVLAELMS